MSLANTSETVTEQEIAQRRTRLEVAFRKIDFLPKDEPHLRGAVDQLSIVDMSGNGTAPQRFREKTRIGGRPPNLRANAVTTITANAFLRLTTNRPTYTIPSNDDDLTPQGAFFELLVEVFDILGVKESAEHYAKKAMDKFTAPGKVKKTRGKTENQEPPSVSGWFPPLD